MKLRTVLSLALIATLSLANSDVDKKVIEFEKNMASKNPRFTLKDVEITTKKPIENAKGWYGYIINIKLDMGGKELALPDTIFSNGKVITREMIDMEKGIDLSETLAPDFDAKYYDDEHIIAGNKNAKHKLALFSDPHCPFCLKYVPEIIKFAKEHPNDVVLYYYHYPLQSIHPLSEIVVKASLVAKKNGVKDIDEKVYNAKLTPRDIVPQKALDEFNEKFGTKISMTDIEAKWVNDAMTKDVEIGGKLIVRGTPTLFIDNKKEEKRGSFKGLVK